MPLAHFLSGGISEWASPTGSYHAHFLFEKKAAEEIYPNWPWKSKRWKLRVLLLNSLDGMKRVTGRTPLTHRCPPTKALPEEGPQS